MENRKWKKGIHSYTGMAGSLLLLTVLLNTALLQFQIAILPKVIESIILILVAFLFFIGPFFLFVGTKIKLKLVISYLYFWSISFSFISLAVSSFKGITYVPISLVLISFLSFGFAYQTFRYDFTLPKRYYAMNYLALFLLFFEVLLYFNA